MNGFMQWLKVNALAVEAASMVVLCLLTGSYVISTWQLVAKQDDIATSQTVEFQKLNQARIATKWHVPIGDVKYGYVGLLNTGRLAAADLSGEWRIIQVSAGKSLKDQISSSELFETDNLEPDETLPIYFSSKLGFEDRNVFLLLAISYGGDGIESGKYQDSFYMWDAEATPKVWRVSSAIGKDHIRVISEHLSEMKKDVQKSAGQHTRRSNDVATSGLDHSWRHAWSAVLTWISSAIAPIVSAVGMIVVAVLAIWGEEFKPSPNLELRPKNLAGERTVLRNQTGREAPVYFYHLELVNRSRTLAKNVRVLCLFIMKKESDGDFEQTTMNVTQQFVWAPAEVSQSSPNILRSHDLDFGWLSNAIFTPRLYVTPHNFRGFAQPGQALRIGLQVVADNYKSDKQYIYEVNFGSLDSTDLDEQNRQLSIREITG